VASKQLEQMNLKLIFIYLPNIYIVPLQGIWICMMSNVIMSEYFQSISKTKHSKLKESPGQAHTHAFKMRSEGGELPVDV